MKLRTLLIPTCLGCAVVGCSSPMMRVTAAQNVRTYAQDRYGGDPSGEPDTIRFRPGTCNGEDLHPEYGRLNEASVLEFLERHHIDGQVERARSDLVFVNIATVGTARPVRLRVAILANADEAGNELHEAMLQHGPGSWGVHRSNLAILGPLATPSDAILFGALTKLACWGVFTVAGTDDTFVVPGAYTEL